MLATIKAGAAVAAIVAGSAFPQVGAQDVEAPVLPAQDQGRFQGDFMDTVIEMLGVSRGDVISHLRAGGVLAELAAENGSSGDELVEALLAVADAKIDDVLADGRIDEARAYELLEAAEDRITTAVFTSRGPGRPGIGSGEFRRLMLDTTMDVLDLNQGQIVSHVRTGGTLADLAGEQGSSGEELEAALFAVVEQRIDEALEAGDITPELADRLVQRAANRIEFLVYEVHTPGRGR